MGRKFGRMSKEEIAFLRDNAAVMSVEAMAEKLNRTVGQVEKNLTLYAPPPTTATREEYDRVVLKQELRSGQKWKILKEELTKDEILLFEEEYLGLMAQFKEDVLHTEEGQIFDAIKLEVLKSRNMVARRKAREDVVRLERMQAELLGKFGGDTSQMDPTDREELRNLDKQVTLSRELEQSKTAEWTKLQERVEKIRQALKANRDQRVKEIESRGQNFVGVIKWLASRDVQEQKDREIALLKLAGERAYSDLGAVHQYEDGSLDRPILSADTVGVEDAAVS